MNVQTQLEVPGKQQAQDVVLAGEPRRTLLVSSVLTAGSWPLYGIALLALVVRTYWILQPRIVWGDEPFYLWLGRSLLAGEGYQFFGISGVHFSPLFPLLAAVMARIIEIFAQPAGPTALMIGSGFWYVVCGTLLVFPVYGLATRLSDRAAGLAAAAITAVYPALTAGIPLWGTLTEPLYLLLIGAAWWMLLVTLQTCRMKAYALSGLLLGLAYLTRSEALVYLVAGLGVLAALQVVFPLGSERNRRRRAIIGIALLLLVFLATISPYLIVLHGLTGKWQLVEEAGSTYVSAQGLAYGDVAAFDRATWGLDPASGEVYLFSPTSEGQGLLEAVIADPRAFVRLVRINLQDLLETIFSSRLIPWPLTGLIVLGLFGRPWNMFRWRGELLLMASLAGPLSFLPFFVQDRYVAGGLIPALVWMGAGVAWLGSWTVDSVTALASRLAHSTLQKVLFLVPSALIVLALLWQAPRLWTALQQTNSFQPGHLTAAQVLRDLGAGAGDVVMTRYPAIAFHAGTRWAPTPAASWSEVVAYARGKGARYLAFDGWEAQLRPQLRFLLDPASAPLFLKHLATIGHGTGLIVLYELVP